MKDFEDAVVASLALDAGCKAIITRNTGDFQKSPIPSMTPDDFLGLTRKP